MDKILISGCLYGLPVRYDGKDNLLTDSLLQQWQQQDRLIVLCPEVSGGLPTPRPPAEIQADGIIRTKNNIDVTDAFLQGAHQAVRLCQQHNIKFAILKENSPSCGSHFIYNGQFNGTKITGQGLTTAALTKMGVQVFSENQVSILDAILDS
ncbi:DUF523 domain-containing protein [Photobacterium profundum]|uniref:Uncharacterized protein n=1 Tax=Photobacterium profundum 3TCK TaxID=314280 RepID=Q1YZJ4_9GAMM|nr:DUF523 domain-containing protein [Photobacterium profundum]EAS41733.1 hypothetical protein P3TCK_23119 [Photobacterium profundum 3TCK]PSV58635.1 DUF523 domain-containing protein [Photobacterium profundum]